MSKKILILAKYIHRLASFLERLCSVQKEAVPVSEKLVEYKTTNSYKAAYLLMKGARYAEDGIRFRPLEMKLIEKRGYKTQYIFHFKQVSTRVLERWDNGTDMVSASEFATSRLRLKRSIMSMMKGK